MQDAGLCCEACAQPFTRESVGKDSCNFWCGRLLSIAAVDLQMNNRAGVVQRIMFAATPKLLAQCECLRPDMLLQPCPYIPATALMHAPGHIVLSAVTVSDPSFFALSSRMFCASNDTCYFPQSSRPLELNQCVLGYADQLAVNETWGPPLQVERGGVIFPTVGVTQPTRAATQTGGYGYDLDF